MHRKQQFYAGTPYIPGELMLPVEPEEREILEAWLGEKRGHKVHFRIPKKGEKEKLVELAAKNAKMVLEKDKESHERNLRPVLLGDQAASASGRKGNEVELRSAIRENICSCRSADHGLFVGII